MEQEKTTKVYKSLYLPSRPRRGRELKTFAHRGEAPLPSTHHLIALDEDGHLILATPTPTGLKIHAKVEILKTNAWTPPSLVGATLYLRDRNNNGTRFEIGRLAAND